MLEMKRFRNKILAVLFCLFNLGALALFLFPLDSFNYSISEQELSFPAYFYIITIDLWGQLWGQTGLLFWILGSIVFLIKRELNYFGFFLSLSSFSFLRQAGIFGKILSRLVQKNIEHPQLFSLLIFSAGVTGLIFLFYNEIIFFINLFRNILSEKLVNRSQKQIEKNKKTAKIDGYVLPNLDLLQKNPKEKLVLEENLLRERAKKLLQILGEFGVEGEIVNIKPGPVITLYEFRPAAGVKSSRIISLSDDIARSMSSLSARVATVPGQNVLGIELPNDFRLAVMLREILENRSETFLPLGLGKDIGGNPQISDLTKMPHLLVAGTTGSGKSVAINAMILSLLYNLTPKQCRFIMIDPKMLELSVYNGIPHLLTPVVTDPKKAVAALKWVVNEMEDRYSVMAKLNVRNIHGYNKRVEELKNESVDRKVQTGFDESTGDPIFEQKKISLDFLPYIVVIVDEMADLMLVAGKEIENLVQRLAQMARAAGIHLIMATQRPSVDVITGIIKANFPTRVSFQVTSKIDSRVILGEMGAEQLLGQGDMLYMEAGGRIKRLHAPFVSDKEVEDVVKFLRSQALDEGPVDIINEIDNFIEDNSADGEAIKGNKEDELYEKAVKWVKQSGEVSTSALQRNFRWGYNTAARFVDRMEKEKIISPKDHSGRRKLL